MFDFPREQPAIQDPRLGDECITLEQALQAAQALATRFRGHITGGHVTAQCPRCRNTTKHSHVRGHVTFECALCGVTHHVRELTPVLPHEPSAPR